jgi:hypothetical protein
LVGSYKICKKSKNLKDKKMITLELGGLKDKIWIKEGGFG